MKAFLACGLLALGFPAQESLPLSSSRESWRLFQGLHRSNRIEIQVAQGLARRAVVRLAQQLSKRGFKATVVDPGKGTDPGAMRVLVGGSEDPGLLELAARAHVEPREGGGFFCLDREFAERGDALIAVFEDPERDGLPLCLFLGNDLDLLSFYLTEIPALSVPFLRVFADGDPALACPLEESGPPRTGEAVDYRSRRESLFREAPVTELTGIRVLSSSAPAPELWEPYAAALERARTSVVRWLEEEEPETVEVRLYEHPRELAECLGQAALAVENALWPRVHVLLASGLPHDGGAAVARVLARSIAGQPTGSWVLDGIGVAAADSWWSRPLVSWVAFLDAAGLMLTPGEIVDDLTAARVSEHVFQPLRGFLFRSLSDRARGSLRPLWAGGGDVQAIGQHFRTALRAVQISAGDAPGPGRGAANRARAQRSPPEGARDGGPAALARGNEEVAAAEFRNGIALVDPEESGGWAYLSEELGESLDRARELGPGPDAVSLTVFASNEEELPPLITTRPRVVHGSASDLSLAGAAAEIRSRDQRLLLALEPLARPGGSWADGEVMADPDEQRAFWRRYEEVAVHYALLCELVQAEIFCLGSNLRDASRTEPSIEVLDERLLEQRHAGWERLIAKVRAAYSGGLTYMARFPGEGQEVGFWDQLDFVGLAFFPSVARPGDPPDSEELRRLLRFDYREAIELGLRWDRPVLLVQTGFPSRADAWTRPWLPGGAPDPEAQLRYYEALAELLETPIENGALLRGFFLWNWCLESSQAGDYSPQEKPAQSLLPRLFSR